MTRTTNYIDGWVHPTVDHSPCQNEFVRRQMLQTALLRLSDLGHCEVLPGLVQALAFRVSEAPVQAMER